MIYSQRVRGYFYDLGGKSKISGLYSIWFWIGLIFKIGCSWLFASEYLTGLFAPFINYFVESGFQNPYLYFNQNGQGIEFPYPPLMLWIMAIPRVIFHPLFSNNFNVISNFDIFIYRIPLLIADFGILLVLLRWLKLHSRKVIFFYWLSPILIYINYFHGQLDIIPISFLVLCLYFLFKEKYWLSIFFLSVALSTKAIILIITPFILFYIYRDRKESTIKIFGLIAFLIGIVFFVNLPYLYSQDFLQMVYHNEVQTRVFLANFEFSSNQIFYIIPALYFLLIVRFLLFRFVNKDLLLMFLAFSFSLLTIFIPPMQGWYYWIIPFFIYFLIKQNQQSILIYATLNLFYFLYFLVIPDSDFGQIVNFSFNIHPIFIIDLFNKLSEADLLLAQNVIFTLLQTSLILTAFYIYKKGISTNLIEKMKYQPFLLGIGGDSGAGKSSLTNALEKVIGVKNTAVLRGDDMHKWERNSENWQNITHLNPKANDLYQDLLHATKLKEGEKIMRKHYEHSIGKFTLPVKIRSNKLILFEGLHPFFLEKQAALFDLKVFVRPDENLRKHWKIIRDVKKRGYSREKIIEQIEKREEDSLKFIHAQSKNADVIVSYFSKNPILEIGDPDEKVEIGLKLIVSHNFGLEPFILLLSSLNSYKIDHTYIDDIQELKLVGDINNKQIEKLAYELLPEIEDLGIYNSIWSNGYEGILQVFICYLMFQISNTY